MQLQLRFPRSPVRHGAFNQQVEVTVSCSLDCGTQEMRQDCRNGLFKVSESLRIGTSWNQDPTISE